MIPIPAGLLAVFIVQNAVVVEIRFMFWSFALSRALPLFFALAVGMAIGWLLRGYFGRRRAEKLPHPSE